MIFLYVIFLLVLLWHLSSNNLQPFLHSIALMLLYSTMISLWPVEDLAELAGGPTGRGEMARGGCLFWLELQCDKVTCTDGGQKVLDQTWRSLH